MENNQIPDAMENTSEASVLADIQTLNYNYASTGQRFFNWLIDNLVMRFGISYLTGAGVGVLLQLISPEILFELASDERGIIFWG